MLVQTDVMLLSVVLCLGLGLSIADDIAEHYEDSSSYIHFEQEEGDSSQLRTLWKKLINMLQKPTYKWTIPTTLSSHPSSCEEYTYCERDDRPADGMYRRLPIYPWWYYSCEGNKVKCQPCPTTEDLDHPTLFFSERCQQCISQYKDERISCPPKEDDEHNFNWEVLAR